MILLDARRLTGPNLYTRVPAVIVELRLDPHEEPASIAVRFFDELSRMMNAVGLTPPDSSARTMVPFRAGAALLFTGPIDTLLAAAEVAEWAAESTTALLAGQAPRALAPKASELAAMVAQQRSPALLSLQAQAAAHGLPLLWDDASVSVGAGARCRSWPRDALPPPEQVPWAQLGGIPIALITGTNGKTTSARLIARMVKAGGRVPGCTSTDGVTVNEVFVERGDCTGPFAARTVLAHPDVEVAVLETARGGILRRGLAVDACDVALLTNVSDDHLGSYGIDDVAAMARVKAVVGHAVRASGKVVLNGDDARLLALRNAFAAEVVLFSLDAGSDAIAQHRARGGEVWFAREGQMWCARGEAERALVDIGAVPITYGGAAHFNVANALGAAATAAALGIGDAPTVRALRTFTPNATDNEGRGNLWTLGGVRVLLDFAHNVAGVRAVLELVRALQCDGALTLVTAQAGDRTDEALREITRALYDGGPTHVILRELSTHLRGRAPGELRALMRDELLRLGMPPERVGAADSEVEALESALATARAGDVVLMLTHTERDSVRHFLIARGGRPA